jgi:hypothetical protein
LHSRPDEESYRRADYRYTEPRSHTPSYATADSFAHRIANYEADTGADNATDADTHGEPNTLSDFDADRASNDEAAEPIAVTYADRTTNTFPDAHANRTTNRTADSAAHGAANIGSHRAAD